jgi:hypothetical protein
MRRHCFAGESGVTRIWLGIQAVSPGARWCELATQRRLAGRSSGFAARREFEKNAIRAQDSDACNE